jgi:hypothetical protein
MHAAYMEEIRKAYTIQIGKPEGQRPIMRFV